MENQNLEWKEVWKDDCLKTLCAFANTDGGTMEIGRNDKGVVVGVKAAKKLLEDLPNKIAQTLGVIAKIKLQKDIISIHVPAYTNAISYHGKFYKRVGSTTQEIIALTLTEFILKKQGRTWDTLTEDTATIENLDIVAIEVFKKKAQKARRLPPDDILLSTPKLLDKLLLFDKNKKLVNAGLLLFGENPERYAIGAFVKVGEFAEHENLLFQDEFHGALIRLPDEISKTIYHKYFKVLVSYEGIMRVETEAVPQEALREAILNAIIHNDYKTGIPIQIKIYEDKIIIYNCGKLPDDWTIDTLLSAHKSHPRNPLIANTFFRAGFIESWGRGIERMNEICDNENSPRPRFEVHGNDFAIIFNFCDKYIQLLSQGEPINATVNTTVNTTVKLTKTQKQILNSISQNNAITTAELSSQLSLHIVSIKTAIKKLQELGQVKRIGSDKTGHWEIVK
ncbi:MAG: putative DNA binding domain-containing protein [Christensenellaceae bacterium]|nr:putative DNA binding domain-containing protein [Christensenellaceae bacterium]